MAEFRREIDRCTFCPNLCRHACPVAEAERAESATPAFKTRTCGRFLSPPFRLARGLMSPGT